MRHIADSYRGRGLLVQGLVQSWELSPCYQEEGVDLSDAVPAGEASKGRISVWEEKKQERDNMMPQDDLM